jgi:lysophospholipase L1-like esterase
VKSLRKGKHKVLIIGDGHTRNCATLVQDKLGTDYEVSSFVKPGAQMNVITQTAREEIKSLKCDDVVVVWGGANDISRNNTKEALKLVTDFVNEHKKVNTVLIKAPHRHDLIPESCVNKAVQKYNMQVRKIMTLQPQVKLLETNLDRNHFTRHGLHLNFKGKDLVSQQLALIIEHIFKKEQTVPIYIPWKVPILVPTNTKTQDVNTEGENTGSAQSFQHQRKCPTWRNPDFLWT